MKSLNSGISFMLLISYLTFLMQPLLLTHSINQAWADTSNQGPYNCAEGVKDPTACKSCIDLCSNTFGNFPNTGITGSDTWNANDDALCNEMGIFNTTGHPNTIPSPNPTFSNCSVNITNNIYSAIHGSTRWPNPSPTTAQSVCTIGGYIQDLCSYHNSQLKNYCLAVQATGGDSPDNSSAIAENKTLEYLDIAVAFTCTIAAAVPDLGAGAASTACGAMALGAGIAEIGAVQDMSSGSVQKYVSGLGGLGGLASGAAAGAGGIQALLTPANKSQLPAAPPQTGSQAAPPQTGSQVAPPQAGSQVAPPQAGSQVAPPQAGSQAAPPQAGSQAGNTTDDVVLEAPGNHEFKPMAKNPPAKTPTVKNNSTEAKPQTNTAEAKPNTAEAKPNTAEAKPNTAEAKPNTPAEGQPSAEEIQEAKDGRVKAAAITAGIFLVMAGIRTFDTQQMVDSLRDNCSSIQDFVTKNPSKRPSSIHIGPSSFNLHLNSKKSFAKFSPMQLKSLLTSFLPLFSKISANSRLGIQAALADSDSPQNPYLRIIQKGSGPDIEALRTPAGQQLFLLIQDKIDEIAQSVQQVGMGATVAGMLPPEAADYAQDIAKLTEEFSQDIKKEAPKFAAAFRKSLMNNAHANSANPLRNPSSNPLQPSAKSSNWGSAPLAVTRKESNTLSPQSSNFSTDIWHSQSSLNIFQIVSDRIEKSFVEFSQKGE